MTTTYHALESSHPDSSVLGTFIWVAALITVLGAATVLKPQARVVKIDTHARAPLQSFVIDEEPMRQAFQSEPFAAVQGRMSEIAGPVQRAAIDTVQDDDFQQTVLGEPFAIPQILIK